MTNLDGRQNEPRPMKHAVLVGWFIIAWLWAGIPLGAGVYFSIQKSLPLFASHALANPGK
ncbi:MAG TPA: hypothetical protein VG056_07935 [Pirellulales bacterium]|nr:hypothetical protein [Pirellulales bacterium]